MNEASSSQGPRVALYERFLRTAGRGACATALAHPGNAIRPRSLAWVGLSLLCLLPVSTGCSGTTNDGIGTTRSTTDGGNGETGGRGNGGASGAPTGGTSGNGSGGSSGSGGSAAGGTTSGGAGGAIGGNTGSGGSSGATGRVPAVHRATAVACDMTRPSFDAGAPKSDAAIGPPVQCRTHEDCTSGQNGRCVGNGHDGWRCTYDACFTDADCPASDGGPGGGRAGVCACENGFRSDNNSCLYNGDCRTDADCGGGYCSPTLGQCGRYAPFVGYYCHTAADECTDDADCASMPNGYCAWSELKGHWACSTNFCVG